MNGRITLLRAVLLVALPGVVLAQNAQQVLGTYEAAYRDNALDAPGFKFATTFMIETGAGHSAPVAEMHFSGTRHYPRPRITFDDVASDTFLVTDATSRFMLVLQTTLTRGTEAIINPDAQVLRTEEHGASVNLPFRAGSLLEFVEVVDAETGEVVQRRNHIVNWCEKSPRFDMSETYRDDFDLSKLVGKRVYIRASMQSSYGLYNNLVVGMVAPERVEACTSEVPASVE